MDLHSGHQPAPRLARGAYGGYRGKPESSGGHAPGLTVTVSVKLEEVDGRRLLFSIRADDDIDKISEGTHERFIIDAAKFNRKVAEKENQGPT